MSERYDRIKERVTSARVARDHGLEVERDGSSGEKALCPFHKDKNPSLKFFQDGGFNCFACDDVNGDAIDLERILGGHAENHDAASELENRYGLESGSRANGSQKNGAAKKRVKNKAGRKEVARWIIRDASGEPRAQHIRYLTWDDEGTEGKEYAYRNADGSYEKGAIKTRRVPLYLSEQVSGYDSDEMILLVEGEKAADAAAGAGIPAVATTAGTEVVPDPEYLEVLRDFRVVLWRDADDPGKRHMADVAEALQYIAAEVRWYEWAKAAEQDDAADHPAVISGDPELLDELQQALRAAPTYDPEKHRPPDPKKEKEDASEDQRDKKKGSDKPPPADRLVVYVLSNTHDLFVDQFGAPHILWEKSPVPLTSSFDSHLRRLFYAMEEKTAGKDAVRQARETLAAFALGSENEKELHTRAAWHESKLYYQLGVGRVIEVDRDGYRPAPDPPMLFRTVKNIRPLPDPEDGGSFDVLRNWVNLKNTRDKRMYIAWLVTAALPHIPRPMLEATGEMGSGKTTASRVAKRTLDPGKPESVRPDPREFLQKASHAHLVMMDNENSLPDWAVDTLCRLVTGEADSKRALYTDDEDFIYEMKRGIILNGINAPTERGDARDRTLPVELERIPETEYRPEEEMWEEFATEHPKLLGAVFETLSGALRAKETLQLDRRARLADWSGYAAAAYEVLGWGAEKFSEDWDRVVKMQNQGTLDGSPLAQAIMHYMENQSEWEGFATDLHATLEAEAEEMSIDVKRDKSWPKSSSWLWRRIKEVRPLLTALGIRADRLDDRRGTVICLARTTPGDGRGDNPRGSTGESENTERGSINAECGSISNLLPHVLPQSPSDTYAESDTRGSSGSISGNSEGKLSRPTEEKRDISPENAENQPSTPPENGTTRKVPRNASTASTASTEGSGEPCEQTREADIEEALEELNAPRSEDAGGTFEDSGEDSGGESEASGESKKETPRERAFRLRDEARAREAGDEPGGVS